VSEHKTTYALFEQHNITLHTTISSPVFNPVELEMPSMICRRPKFKQGLQKGRNIYMMFGIVSQCVTST